VVGFVVYPLLQNVLTCIYNIVSIIGDDVIVYKRKGVSFDA